jgi:hypothetical protein
MKIESARFNSDRKSFSVSFSDGITIILNEQLMYKHMISTGLDSFYATKGKWPKGKNLEKRITLGVEWIEKNKSRYKKVAISQ